MPKFVTSQASLSQRNEIADESLGNRFDALNEAIIEAESRLHSMRPVCSVWFKYKSEYMPNGPSRTYSIGFAKYNGKWRIVHCVDDEDAYPEGAPVFPLTDRPIEERVYAAAHIPELYQLIVTGKEEFIAKVNETISLLNSFTRKD